MRHELPEIVSLASRLFATELPATFATLLAAKGSTYRPLGSLMVGLPGMHAGAVSGGCLEDYIAREGVIATRDRHAAILTFSTGLDSSDDIPVSGCGGTIDVLVERLTGSHVEFLRELARAYDADTASLNACVVDRSHGHVVVTRRWIDLQNDVYDIDPGFGEICRGTLRNRKSSQVSLGPQTSVLLHYVPAVTRLVIVGAADDARPLCRIARSLGWHVTVIDRRARLATTGRFPDADAVLAGDWADVVDAVRITPKTALVLMTHSLEDDARVLSMLAGRMPSYIGALGPARRRQGLLDMAAELGTPLTDALATRVHGPIGLDLGDRSAAGIAVAVAAEIAAWANDREARPLYTTSSNLRQSA
jgi:xanthine dehydrogenase accessory factor